jgi:hypothetical protein
MKRIDILFTTSADQLLLFRSKDGLCARHLRKIVAVQDGVFNHLQDRRNVVVVIDDSKILGN